MTCINLFTDLSKVIENINDKFIDDFTSKSMNYDMSCIKSNITYDKYFEILKSDWDVIMNDFIDKNKNCNSVISSAMSNIKTINDVATGTTTINDAFINSILSYVFGNNKKFETDANVVSTMKKIVQIFIENCPCQMMDIFRVFISKYKGKYKKEYEGMDKNELKRLLKQKYNDMKLFFVNTSQSDIEGAQNKITENIATELSSMYSFSIDGELNKLIPDSMGSLKDFFIKIISTYCQQLHPIVWCQIFRAIVDNIFVVCPMGKDEIFGFVSNQLLLNSSPFILKTLQAIRPLLSDKQAEEYNITKLTYPIMSDKQVEIILNKIVDDRNMYKIVKRSSASVGFVLIMSRVNNPKDIFVVKIIKPLSISQSCWEYSVLGSLFPKDSCEENFIKNMLKSNGREMNVQNEKANIREGSKCYTCDYDKIFSMDCSMKLRTVDVRTDVTDESSWYGFTMTMAPGIPLSKLIEENHLKEDTKYRSALHRGLDLLVYKFFFNLISNGFYHGDLHSGNIFFSYEKKQMTLIDFGAVGRLDLFSGDDTVLEMLDIIVMSLFYNYEGILDKMTKLLNSKCTETQIDTTTEKYKQFRIKLSEYHTQNTINSEREDKIKEQLGNHIFGSKRLEEEKSMKEPEKITIDNIAYDSIYSYLEIPKNKEETIIENRDVLPQFMETLGDTQSVTFSFILKSLIEFYANSGVNVAIKFSSMYELQKGYALILGVLEKAGYNSYRTAIVLKKAIVNLKHITKIRHIGTIAHVISTYMKERHSQKLIPENIMNQHKADSDQYIKFDEGIQKLMKTSPLEETETHSQKLVPDSEQYINLNEDISNLMKNMPIEEPEIKRESHMYSDVDLTKKFV